MRDGSTRVGPFKIKARRLRVIAALVLCLGFVLAGSAVYSYLVSPRLEILQSTYSQPLPSEIQFRVVVRNSGTVYGSGVLVCIYEFPQDSVQFSERLNVSLNPNETREYIVIVKLPVEYSTKTGTPSSHLEE